MSISERLSHQDKFTQAAIMVVNAAFELNVVRPDDFDTEVAWQAFTLAYVAGKPMRTRRKIAQRIQDILQKSPGDPVHVALIADHVHTKLLRTLNVPPEHTPSF